MGGVGPMQILIIVLLVVVLFGARKLPEAARAVGRSMRIFKSEMRELEQDKQGNRGPVGEGATVQQAQEQQRPPETA